MSHATSFKPVLVAIIVVWVLPMVYAQPGHDGSSLCIALGASSLDGLHGDTRIEAGGVDFRLNIDWPLASEADACLVDAPSVAMYLKAPSLQLGTIKPEGLMAFVYRPGSSVPLLLYSRPTPFAIDNPKYARYIGLSTGESHGMFLVTRMLACKAVDTSNAAYGAWFSPFHGELSLMALSSIEASEPGGPGWYDVGSPTTRRVFGAVSARRGGSLWSVAAAAAGCAAFPGQDAAVCRLEARVVAGSVRLTGEASAVAGLWHGPDGYEATPALNAHAELRFARRFLVTTIGYRYSMANPGATSLVVIDTEADTNDALIGSNSSSRYVITLETCGSWGLARVASTLTDASAGNPDAVSFDTSFVPAALRWLTLASSWRVSEGHSSRFDMLAKACLGDRLRLCADAGLRYVPEGTLVKGGLLCTLKPASWSASISIRSDGWIHADASWTQHLEYALTMDASLP